MWVLIPDPLFPLHHLHPANEESKASVKSKVIQLGSGTVGLRTQVCPQERQVLEEQKRCGRVHLESVAPLAAWTARAWVGPVRGHPTTTAAP